MFLAAFAILTGQFDGATIMNMTPQRFFKSIVNINPHPYNP
jgi:hypothetical protein